MPKMLSLPDVTLLAVSSVDIEATVEALHVSSRHIDFGAVKLLTSAPVGTRDAIEVVAIPPLDLRGYSAFVLRELYRHVATRHCLIVQADGFVLDAARWEPAFLDCDYIGAPWPPYLALGPSGRYLDLSRNRVGNGGFSLRSRQLLEAVAELCASGIQIHSLPEDLVTCQLLLEELRARSLRFAPLDIALRFSAERPVEMGGVTLDRVFGFHGKHFLAEARTRTAHRPA